MAAYLIWAGLALLFVVNAVIALPLSRPVELHRGSVKEIDPQKKLWYTLAEGSYVVGSSFASTNIRSSFLPIFSTQYTYYLVTVRPETDEVFPLAVRVTPKKQANLEKGEAVALYGMVSELDNKTAEQFYEAADGQTAKSYCLNDNDETVVTRIFKAGMFVLLAGLCIFAIVRIARR